MMETAASQATTSTASHHFPFLTLSTGTAAGELARINITTQEISSLLLILLGGVLTSRHAAADVASCESLGAALTEHSCFHAQFGPFDTVQASRGAVPDASTPAIDSVHTEYRLILAASDDLSIVTYSPVRGGQWVVFSASDIPLILEDPSGTPLLLLRTDAGTTV